MGCWRPSGFGHPGEVLEAGFEVALDRGPGPGIFERCLSDEGFDPVEGEDRHGVLGLPPYEVVGDLHGAAGLAVPASHPLQLDHLRAVGLPALLGPKYEGASLVDPDRNIALPEDVVLDQADHIPVGEQGVGDETLGEGFVRLRPPSELAFEHRVGDGDPLLPVGPCPLADAGLGDADVEFAVDGVCEEVGCDPVRVARVVLHQPPGPCVVQGLHGSGGAAGRSWVREMNRAVVEDALGWHGSIVLNPAPGCRDARAVPVDGQQSI